MKPLLCLLAAFIALAVPVRSASAQDAPKGPPTQPILRIETGGHTAIVWGVAVDRKGRFMATCAGDKSVRIWELPSLRLLRVLHPPLGMTVGEGALNALALSPDGSTVALGGSTGHEWSNRTCVYFFDRESGRLTRRIQVGSRSNFVEALAFSPDGRRLAVGLFAAGLRVFDIASGSLAFEDRGYRDEVCGVDFDTKGRLAACSFDRSVRLYDETGGVLANAVRPEGAKPCRLAFSPDGTRLAVGDIARPAVAVFDGRDLHALYEPNPKGGAKASTSVAWSRDGTALYAGGYAENPLNHQFIYRWAGAGRGVVADFGVKNDAIYALASLPTGGVAFAAGDGLGTLGTDGKVAQVDNAVADPRDLGAGFQLTRDGDAVRFAFAPDGKEAVAFSITTRLLDSNPKDEPARPLATSPRLTTDAFAVTDWKDSFDPKLDGVTLPLSKHEQSLSLAVLPDASGFLLGCDWSLRRFGRNGKARWVVPISGALAANVTGDGRLAVAALGDGTVRWYRLSDGKELLALYAHPDKKRWVLWTPSGYYDCSPGGEDLIGWNVNNGPDHEADFYPASRFRSTYYRPDVIAKILGTLDEVEAVRQADAEANRKAPTQNVAEILPPLARIVGEPTIADGKATLRFALRTPTDEPVVKLQYLVDGRTVKEETGLSLVAKTEVERTAEFEATEGANLSVIASNRFGAGEPATSAPPRARATSATDPIAQTPSGIRPKLYVLAIGVGMPGGGAPELTYPAKDAKDFAAALLRQKGGLYEDVQIRLLTEGAATRDAIADGLDWVVKETTQHDVAMILVSGHGDNDPRGDYYFLPENFDPDHLSRTALYFSELRKAVEALPGKTLLFVDTCHAGNALGGMKKGFDDINGVVNELASAENGAVVFTACTGKETALEDPQWGNGAFTLAVLECLAGKDREGAVTVTSLDAWIARRVKALTGGKQHPATQKPSTVPDFPIAIAGGKAS